LINDMTVMESVCWPAFRSAWTANDSGADHVAAKLLAKVDANPDSWPIFAKAVILECAENSKLRWNDAYARQCGEGMGHA